MILHVENHKDFIKKLVTIEFSKVAGYKINTYKICCFLTLIMIYKKNKLRKQSHYTIASKRIKYLGI